MMASERRNPPESTASSTNGAATPLAGPFERPPVEPPALLLGAPLFWEKYKVPILGALAVVALGLIGSAVYGTIQARRLAAAGSALTAAKTPEDFRRVIDAYPGTPPAADAYLLLARAQREAGDAAGAEKTLRDFTERFGQNPLAGGAMLALAGELQSRGDRDGALALYQQTADRYPKSYSAPLALLGKGELQRITGKTDDAKRTFENLIATYPGSVSAQQAQSTLRFLRAPVAAKTTAAATTPSSTPSPAPTAAATLAAPSPSTTP